MQQGRFSPNETYQTDDITRKITNHVFSLLIDVFLGKRLQVITGNYERAVRFLEELDELSTWMNTTRGLLEGHKANKPGCNVDPEVCVSIITIQNIFFLLKLI